MIATHARPTTPFQSTFPRGERPSWLRHSHAHHFNFNPRSRVGNDPVNAQNPVSGLFQSTFPRGERRKRSNQGTWQRYFNPRSRVGNDGGKNMKRHPIMISIHVPAWGTTQYSDGLASVSVISIHVPAWGTTANFNNFSLIYSYK